MAAARTEVMTGFENFIFFSYLVDSFCWYLGFLKTKILFYETKIWWFLFCFFFRNHKNSTKHGAGLESYDTPFFNKRYTLLYKFSTCGLCSVFFYTYQYTVFIVLYLLALRMGLKDGTEDRIWQMGKCHLSYRALTVCRSPIFTMNCTVLLTSYSTLLYSTVEVCLRLTFFHSYSTTGW